MQDKSQYMNKEKVKFPQIFEYFFIGISCYTIGWNLIEPWELCRELKILIPLLVTTLGLIIWIFKISSHTKKYFYFTIKEIFYGLKETISLELNDTDIKEKWIYGEDGKDLMKTEIVTDVELGKVWQIKSSKKYNATRGVKIQSQFCTNIEYCVNPLDDVIDDIVFYVQVEFINNNINLETNWITYTSNLTKAQVTGKFHPDSKNTEYIYFKQPALTFGNWMLFSHNIKKDFKKAWPDQKLNRITDIRLR